MQTVDPLQDAAGFEPVDAVENLIRLRFSPNRTKIFNELATSSSNPMHPSLINEVMTILSIQYRFYNYSGLYHVDRIQTVNNPRRVVQILPNDKKEYFCVTTLAGVDQSEPPVFRCYGVSENMDAGLKNQISRLLGGKEDFRMKNGWTAYPRDWMGQVEESFPSIFQAYDEESGESREKQPWRPNDSGAIACVAAVSLCEGRQLATATWLARDIKLHLMSCLCNLKMDECPTFLSN